MLKSLKRRLKKSKSQNLLSSEAEEPQIASGTTPPVTTTTTTTTPPDPPQTERYGLFRLDESEPINSVAQDSFDMAIVAVHGLNGDAYTSWEHENGTLWLRDLLPDTIPGARIFTYGYPSHLFLSKSTASLRDYSQRLLSSLNDVLDEVGQRPIIFVCHSLGGIVCKQALVLAHEDNERYGNILTATTAIVFLGTPHRGASGTTDVGKVVGGVINACLYLSKSAGMLGTTRTDLLDTLSANSDALKDLATSFRNRLRKLEIVTFYETELTPPLAQLVVDRFSAIMDIPDEEVIPLFANHLTMCRYSGKTQEYDTVSKALRRLARKAHSKQQATNQATSMASDRSFNETEKYCMILFHTSDIAEYRAELPKRVEGTCCWILTHPKYVSWVSNQETTLLWINGNPGCGKTILSAYLTEHLDTVQRNGMHEMVCCFFCDDKIASQRDAKAILRSVIYQVLHRRRSLLRHVKIAYDIQGSQLFHSFDALWNIFIAIINDQRSGPISVIVDAIDECEEKTRVRFLDAVTGLIQKPKVVNDQLPNCVRFLITSRPSLGITYDFNSFWRDQLPLEESQEGISKDVQTFIERRVDEIVKRCGCTPRTKHFLEQSLYSRAGQTFLWVKVVLRCLETSLLASQKDFQNILSTLPQDLEEVYENFLRSIPTQNQKSAAKILHILVGSPRYLTLDEMGIIMAIDTDHRTVADVEADRQPSTRRTVQGILGPLIRISESKISLVHQSAKEFLIDLAGRSKHPLASIYGVNQVKAAMILASSCISYLLLEDFVEDLFLRDCSSSAKSSDDSPVLGENGSDSGETFFDPFALEGDIILKDERVVEAELYQFVTDRYKFFDFSAMYWAESFALCEHMAPGDIQRAALSLNRKHNCYRNNWLRYFWDKTGMECALPDDMDPLILASFFNQPILLSHLLNENGSYDQHSKDLALFWAARMDSGKTTEILLRNCADPNSRIVDQQTSLSVAAQYGHSYILKLLLADERTDVNVQAKSGRSPLSLASGNGHLPVVKLLISHKHCRPDEQDHNRWTPLLWAVGGDHLDVVSELLQSKKVDINHTDRTGRTVFSWAVGDGSALLLKFFLKNPQLEPDILDNNDRSALSWAAGNGNTETVRVLVRSKRCNKSKKDVNGRNAISWACDGGHDRVLKILIKYDCPGVDDEDVDGWTPLAWALKNKSLVTVETIVSTGLVDIERRDLDGRTALTWAAYYGYLDVVHYLLQEGADARTMDNHGRTPLGDAIAYGHADVVQELDMWLGRRTMLSSQDNPESF